MTAKILSIYRYRHILFRKYHHIPLQNEICPKTYNAKKDFPRQVGICSNDNVLDSNINVNKWIFLSFEICIPKIRDIQTLIFLDRQVQCAPAPPPNSSEERAAYNIRLLKLHAIFIFDLSSISNVKVGFNVLPMQC